MPPSAVGILRGHHRVDRIDNRVVNRCVLEIQTLVQACQETNRRRRRVVVDQRLVGFELSLSPDIPTTRPLIDWNMLATTFGADAIGNLLALLGCKFDAVTPSATAQLTQNQCVGDFQSRIEMYLIFGHFMSAQKCDPYRWRTRWLHPNTMWSRDTFAVAVLSVCATYPRVPSMIGNMSAHKLGRLAERVFGNA